jgi:hypothetical protein
VKPNRPIVRGHLCEERDKTRIIQWKPIDVGVGLNANGAELIDGAVDFLQRRRHIVQGDACDESGKSRRILRAKLGHLIVRNSRKVASPFGACALLE